jgi:ribosome-associated protein
MKQRRNSHIGPLESPGAGPVDGSEAPERPSRSARKRSAEALQRLGVELTRLKPLQLRALELPESLVEAVLEAQRLHSRAALARQRQYIGRLMRDIDPAPIERALSEYQRR